MASDSVLVPLAKVPLAPEVGAVKVTFSPTVRTPLVVTVTVKGPANGLPTAALCDKAPVAVIVTTCGVAVVAEFELLLPLAQPPKKTRDRPINAEISA